MTRGDRSVPWTAVISVIAASAVACLGGAPSTVRPTDAGMTGVDGTTPPASDGGTPEAATDLEAAAPDAAPLVCDAATPVCNGVCVDPSTFQGDAANCGRCGHSCAPGLCSGGSCQPWVIAQPPLIQKPSSLVSDGTNLIWLDFGASLIQELPLTGGTVPVTLANDPGIVNASNLSLGAGVVAWSESNALWTAVVGQPGSGAKRSYPFAAGVTLLPAINATATHIAALETNFGGATFTEELYDCVLGAASCTDVGPVTYSFASALGATATAFFFTTEDGALHAFPFGSGAYTTLTAAETEPASSSLSTRHTSTGIQVRCLLRPTRSPALRSKERPSNPRSRTFPAGSRRSRQTRRTCIFVLPHQRCRRRRPDRHAGARRLRPRRSLLLVHRHHARGPTDFACARGRRDRVDRRRNSHDLWNTKTVVLPNRIGNVSRRPRTLAFQRSARCG